MSCPIFFDRTFDKTRLKNLVDWTFNIHGSESTLELVERLKNFGFDVGLGRRASPRRSGGGWKPE